MALAETAAAIGGGKVLACGGAGQGKMCFDGRTQTFTGVDCRDCHSVIFEMRKDALTSMTDHSVPMACCDCHNGQRAFNNCEKCRRKL